ncbi:MAG: hypothetical protein ACYTXA_30700 [Nostoc sp.]
MRAIANLVNEFPLAEDVV